MVLSHLRPGRSAGPSGFDPDWWRKVSYKPMLFPPLALAAGVGVSLLWPGWFQHIQTWLEAPAPYLMLLVSALYAVRTVATRNPLYLILTVLAATFACREFHFAGTHRGVYAVLGLLAVWVVLWRNRLFWVLRRDYRHFSWLLAMVVAYVLSQLLARRALKFLPGEAVSHRSLEEWTETAAHLVFLTAALVGTWKPWTGLPSQPVDAHDDAPEPQAV